MEKPANVRIYEALPADGSQIRLVTIHPGDTTDSVECTVENFPFVETRGSYSYEALSYVWGDATSSTSISLNGASFQVTRNLENAIRALRLQDRKRIVWIDALCINQTNIQERNQEVRRMGKIYSQAEHVVVWLGPDTTIQGECVAGKTIDFLNLLADASPQDPEAAATAMIKAPNGLYSVQLVHKFFYQPWFNRVWILQEIVLAKTATIVYGDRQIGWDRLLGAIDALRRLQLGQHTHIWRLSGAARADSVRMCWLRVRNARSEEKPSRSIHLELADLLWQTRFFGKSEPRDRLYGILGLLKFDVSSEKLLEVDYKKPVADVFRDLAIFMFKGGMLSHALCSVVDSMEDLPSWASTWTSELKGDAASRLSPGLATYMQIHELKGLRTPPNAPHFSTDLRQITLRGHVFTPGIQHTGKGFKPHESKLSTYDESISLCHARLVEWEDEMQRQECSRAIFKTRDERRKAWKYALLHELPGGGVETIKNYDLLTNRNGNVPQVKDGPLIVRAMVDLQSKLGIHCNFRKPFITASGLMGSTGANREVQIGDRVCVFVGSAVPYILRPLSPSRGLYMFIACCWVPELVGLDVLGGQNEGLWELEDITLV
ncbi:heterokaryon incompatibility protein-domain-containing protein [Daldinia caldariorum]|uniref:heterokaryon incompatibility protein-domain-containing protein n=1 Tax=Daldinia caldariorum TaxID=326644 RepID=UPI002008AEF2|nr:heterokaryon incompatibility protein-domain-containing protein [Daldinia caldariorum]KAI1463434.1 heterokaryon incompatibility protein-domain-containing protein [Daldinia caldariorum]